jgi:hypothetical protein
MQHNPIGIDRGALRYKAARRGQIIVAGYAPSMPAPGPTECFATAAAAIFPL